MGAHAGERLTAPALPACWCGQVAVLEVSLHDGTRYFCAAHQEDGERLFESSQ